MRLSEIAGAVGSSVSFDAPVRSVVTDSRKACAGTVFVAIRGEALDGNDFAAQALANGAEAAVVERRMPGADPARCILVPDGKRALIKIGGAYRSRFQIPFVGVTGSVGKTTTKEFIHAVLSAKYHTLKNEGNQNNEIGVPNTLFNLTPRHETAVIEMGMSGFGEIRDLTLAVRPSVGVITSIGVSHIEMLGSRENILKAKLELLEGMPDGAPLLLCGDNDLLAAVCSDRLRVCRYGMENQDCQIRAVNVEQHGEDSTSFVIASPGEAIPPRFRSLDGTMFSMRSPPSEPAACSGSSLPLPPPRFPPTVPPGCGRSRCPGTEPPSSRTATTVHPTRCAPPR